MAQVKSCLHLSADPESAVQEQALALVRNLVDGCIQSIEYVFAENGIILDAMGRQLQYAAKAEIGIQVRTIFLHNSSYSSIKRFKSVNRM